MDGKAKQANDRMSTNANKQVGVHSRDEDGLTPLHWAKTGDEARRLIEDGADIEALGCEDNRPIHRATKLCRTDVVSVLIEYKADVNAIDVYRQSVLHVCRSADTTRLLLENGANIDALDEDLGTPLHTAAHADGRRWILSTLLEYDCELDLRDKDGRTALHLATLDLNYIKAQLLAESGADLTIKDNAGKTALDYAAYVDENLTLMFEAYKLSMVGLYIKDQNRDVCKSDDFAEVISQRAEEIAEELKMMNRKLNRAFTLKKILLTNDPRYVSDEVLMNILKRIDFSDFVSFGRLIERKIKKDIRKVKLLQRSKSVIDLIFRASCKSIIPDEVSIMILCYLNNKELEKLIQCGESLSRITAKVD